MKQDAQQELKLCCADALREQEQPAPFRGRFWNVSEVS